jgi:TadE-like protein.
MNKKKQFGQKLRKNERGQSMVELAISLVLILVILAGIFDLGRAIIAYLVLQDAAEEGIVYGVGFPTDCNQITSRIRGDINNTLISSQVMVAITIQNTSGNYSSCYSIPYAQVYAGRIMRIKVTTDFPISMPFLGTFLGKQTIPLVVTTNGVILRPPPPT